MIPLRPIDSETRQVKDLSGLWQFSCDTDKTDALEDDSWIAHPWPQQGLPNSQLMPVPASINDLTQDSAIRDHLGIIWYQLDDFIPADWANKKLSLWIGSATHVARVWINGQHCAYHEGGFLPFSAEANEHVRFGARNRITIAIDTRLSWKILPPGQVVDNKGRKELPDDWQQLEFHFDFFNYVGLHRPVKWHVEPKGGVQDFQLTPGLRDGAGILSYRLEHGGDNVEISVCDGDNVVASWTAPTEAELIVPGITPWAPGKPKLYDVVVKIFSGGEVIDVYRRRTGFRSVEIQGDKFLINGEEFYFTGYGRHEDASLRGRGLDLVHQMKDANLLRWTGANSFRTAHYPYAEEAMEIADELGIVVIDEVPAVGLGIWSKWGQDGIIFTEEMAGQALREHHCQVVKDLIKRDQHHPCVVSWSLGNETATYETGSRPHYQAVVEASRELDTSRPLMYVINVPAEQDHIGDLFDILGVNSYKSWYDCTGRLDAIQHIMAPELRGFWDKYQVPIMLTEYGVDTIAGCHQDPPVMFSEEYQVAFYKAYHAALDELPFVVGEQVWNFADFQTKQGLTRVDGNKKGIFTRDRRPKMAAHELRARWTAIEKNSYAKPNPKTEK